MVKVTSITLPQCHTELISSLSEQFKTGKFTRKTETNEAAVGEFDPLLPDLLITAVKQQHIIGIPVGEQRSER